MVRTQRFIGIKLPSLFSMKSTPLETNKQKIENKLFFPHIVPAHASFGDFPSAKSYSDPSVDYLGMLLLLSVPSSQTAANKDLKKLFPPQDAHGSCCFTEQDATGTPPPMRRVPRISGTRMQALLPGIWRSFSLLCRREGAESHATCLQNLKVISFKNNAKFSW